MEAIPTMNAGKVSVVDLTGNDIALALTSIELVMGWWKKAKGRRTKYVREEIRRLVVLSAKLQFILSQAYPSHLTDYDSFSSGDEVIARIDKAAIRRLNAQRRKTRRLLDRLAAKTAREVKARIQRRKKAAASLVLGRAG